MMRYSPIVLALTLATLLSLVACSDQSHGPTLPDDGTAALTEPGDKAAPQQIQFDPQFLSDLQWAFDSTVWERVVFTEEKADGTLIGYPSSFADGGYVSVGPPPGGSLPKSNEPIEVYVMGEFFPVTGGCIIFKFNGLVRDAEYVITTFLPTWVDDAADLGVQHTTYQLIPDGDGQNYSVAGLTRYDTPPWPYGYPPVKFSVLGPDPGLPDRTQWVADPNEPGDD